MHSREAEYIKGEPCYSSHLPPVILGTAKRGWPLTCREQFAMPRDEEKNSTPVFFLFVDT